MTGGDLENRVYDRGDRRRRPRGPRGAGRRPARSPPATPPGVIHRDVKPSNLLLNEAGAVTLIDFGLARDFGSTVTGPRMLLGSLEFLAPEQLQDAPTAGEPADVYGLGATLFWALTGHLPYPQQTSSGRGRDRGVPGRPAAAACAS